MAWNLVRLGSILLLATALAPVARSAAIDLPFDTNRVGTVELRIAEADWKVLRYQHREAEFFPEDGPKPSTNAYSWFPAEAVVDGRSVGRVEVRKKGYIGSNDPRRPGLKIRARRGDAAGAGGGLLPELTLNNNSQDPSFVRQYLAYETFRRAGVPAPRCAFVKVSVNGKSLGIYTRVEPINELFLRDRFGRADGNLYEGGRSDFRPGWTANFDFKGPARAAHHTDLERTTQDLEAAGASPMGALERHFDAEEFFRFWAVECLINQGDGYAGNCNNFLLYHHPGTDRFVFIPWGPDSAFYLGRALNAVKGDPKSVIATGILAHRLYQSPAGAERYRATLRRVLDGAWNEELLLREVARLETLLTPHVEGDPAAFKGNVEQLRTFISGRRAAISPELEGAAPELKSKPLTLARRRNVGRFEGSFLATWRPVDPAGAGDGSGKLAARLWDKTLTFASVKAQAGPVAGNELFGDGPLIVLAADGPPGEPGYFLFFSIDPDSCEPGQPIPIDNTHVFGACVRRDGAGRISGMIGMLRGTLLLRSYGRNTGDRVEGEFKADLFSKLPGP